MDRANVGSVNLPAKFIGTCGALYSLTQFALQVGRSLLRECDGRDLGKFTGVRTRRNRVAAFVPCSAI